MPVTAIRLARSRNAAGDLVARVGVRLLDEYLGCGHDRPGPGPHWLYGSLVDVGGCLFVVARCRVAVQGGAYAIDDQLQPVLEGVLAVG
jgi:hypothetical protein